MKSMQRCAILAVMLLSALARPQSTKGSHSRSNQVAPDGGWSQLIGSMENMRTAMARLHLEAAGTAMPDAQASVAVLRQQMKLVAANATMLVRKNTGHWLMEENSQETTEALMKFL